MKNIELYNGDCLKIMDELIKNNIKIDTIITDPPYGTTACSWDSVIPFEEMWKKLNLLIKSNGAIALFGSEPFSSALRMSNIKNYKYDWVWEKSTSAGFIHAKNMPLKRTENILMFSLGSMGHYSLLGNSRMVYNPQDLIKINKNHKRPRSFGNEKTVIGTRPSHITEWKVEYENYPTNILKYLKGNQNNIHPTQKPVALMEYLIKTYTNENEIVLDFTMGSGTTGIACLNTNRKFIGIEKDDKYFKLAKNRIENHKIQQKLF